MPEEKPEFKSCPHACRIGIFENVYCSHYGPCGDLLLLGVTEMDSRGCRRYLRGKGIPDDVDVDLDLSIQDDKHAQKGEIQKMPSYVEDRLMRAYNRSWREKEFIPKNARAFLSVVSHLSEAYDVSKHASLVKRVKGKLEKAA